MGDTIRASIAEATWTRASFWKLLWSAMRDALGKVRIQKKQRALRVEEMLQLGEKRFLAVVRWNQQTLLVGVTPQAITLLEPRTKNDAVLVGFDMERDA